MLQVRDDPGALAAQRRILVHHQRRHFRIGQPRRRADDRISELCPAHLAVRAHVHFAHHGQAIHVGPQRAKVIGQYLRQHRHDAVGEIHRGAAFTRRDIQCRTGTHVMGDIGNGDNEAPGFSIWARGFAVHGIVEIPRVFPINSDQRHVTQVQPAAHRQRRMGVHLRRLALHILAPLVRNATGAHRNFRGHAGRSMFTQYFHDTAYGLRMARGLGHDLGHDKLPIPGIH